MNVRNHQPPLRGSEEVVNSYLHAFFSHQEILVIFDVQIPTGKRRLGIGAFVSVSTPPHTPPYTHQPESAKHYEIEAAAVVLTTAVFIFYFGYSLYSNEPSKWPNDAFHYPVLWFDDQFCQHAQTKLCNSLAHLLKDKKITNAIQDFFKWQLKKLVIKKLHIIFCWVFLERRRWDETSRISWKMMKWPNWELFSLTIGLNEHPVLAGSFSVSVLYSPCAWTSHTHTHIAPCLVLAPIISGNSWAPPRSVLFCESNNWNRKRNDKILFLHWSTERLIHAQRHNHVAN